MLSKATEECNINPREIAEDKRSAEAKEVNKVGSRFRRIGTKFKELLKFCSMSSKQKAEKSTRTVKNENDADADKIQTYDKSVFRLIHLYSYFFFWSLFSDVKLLTLSKLAFPIIFVKIIFLLPTIFPQFSDFLNRNEFKIVMTYLFFLVLIGDFFFFGANYILFVSIIFQIFYVEFKRRGNGRNPIICFTKHVFLMFLQALVPLFFVFALPYLEPILYSIYCHTKLKKWNKIKKNLISLEDCLILVPKIFAAFGSTEKFFLSKALINVIAFFHYVFSMMVFFFPSFPLQIIHYTTSSRPSIKAGKIFVIAFALLAILSQIVLNFLLPEPKPKHSGVVMM